MGLKTVVLITGAISALVWLVPSLVTFGLFMLVIPGLILAVMPTIFVYLLATLAIRSILPIGGWTGLGLSFGLAVALGFILPQPLRLIQTSRYNQAMLPEIVPTQPVALSGEILVIQRSREGLRPSQPTCNALCAALLAVPGVSGVTIRHEAEGAADAKQVHFHLDPAQAGRADGPAPHKPEEIVNHLPDTAEKRPSGPRIEETDPRAQLRRAVISDWAMRLASEAGLVEQATGPAPDWTVTITNGIGGKWQPLIHRVEVMRTGQTPALRRSLVSQKRIAAPFHFGFEGGIENARFVVGHSRLANGPAYPNFDPFRELLEHSSLARSLPPIGQSGELRAKVVAALGNPSASDDQLQLARGWMDSLGYRPAPDDLDLVNRIIADQRITGIRNQVNRFYAKTIPLELRQPMVARIRNPASSEDERRAYAQLLSKLPEGTFARLTADETQILADPALRRQAAPLIERLADQGQPGLAALMQILESEIASDTQWAVQRPVVRAVRRGLARLGPAAASALPRIEELFARPRNPLANLSQEADEWRVAMARMGKPIDQLPFPGNARPERLERDKERVRKRLAGFDPAWESGYSY